MNRPRLFFWLRVAVSAVCLMVFIGLIGLWVRSYSYLHFCQMNIAHGKTLHIQSVNGQLMFFALFLNRKWQMGYFSVKHIAESPVYEQAVTGTAIPGGISINIWSSPTSGIKIPIWTLAPLPAAIGFIISLPLIPWHKLRWQFSLRTLLIVTTLVAVVLGFSVYLLR